VTISWLKSITLQFQLFIRFAYQDQEMAPQMPTIKESTHASEAWWAFIDSNGKPYRGPVVGWRNAGWRGKKDVKKRSIGFRQKGPRGTEPGECE